MEQIVDLLNEKNLHLERFYRLNEQELLNFGEGNFDNLEEFYNSREGILDMIRCIDNMIEESNASAVNESRIEDRFKKQIIKALNIKNDLVTRILSQDLQILSFIESAKSEIIKELSQVRVARKAIGSYKSGDVIKRLDEKF